MTAGVPNPQPAVSLIMIEGSLTLIMIAAAFAWPRLGSAFFSRIERGFSRLATRRTRAVVLVGSLAILLRLAILPLSPMPLPFVQDDFSFLLASDTFARGRLTNPTPAMWMHFETFHVSMQPTYMSMYFPAQGLILAAGKVLLGQPWFGILIVTALMCASICWTLQAWLPPAWALLGGLLAVMRLGLFSYWIDTYSGAGSIAALGGALMLGALPRLIKTNRAAYSAVLAIGMIVLANSRPYEGLLLSLPVLFVLARWVFGDKERPSGRTLLRLAAVPILLFSAAGSWMAYYNYRAFGNPLIEPYVLNRSTYAVTPYWAWQPLRPAPAYHHKVMHDFYIDWERPYAAHLRTPSGFLAGTLVKLARTFFFFAGIVLLPPLLMLPLACRDRRTRFFAVCTLIAAVGLAVEVYLIPHYLAPFTVAFYALGLQAMRRLRVWRPGDQPVGAAIFRGTVLVCVLLAAARVWAHPLHLRFPRWPSSEWTSEWYGPGRQGEPRAHIERTLETMPGQQLVLVRYLPTHDPLDEWVYNAADIDHAKVIWAREMNPAEDRELLEYYKDRKVWLVEPDQMPATLAPYAAAKQETTLLR